ncbi:hypothetical protein DSL92_07465 [Billgrantia gudaonensis]|uniref:Arginyl tRNA synthetase N-terminal domain-containing protein n=1 Tax=Billgrantia gudaonensis TaxID=376427 RepID=A0A432JH18_9GAMM|nr:hypothetical protein DSL92_07465 [Halomonas gudaonensis]
MKETIVALLEDALETLKQQGTLPADITPTIKVDPARDKAHGDYATNLALALAKPAGCKPRDLAEALIAALPASDAVAKSRSPAPASSIFRRHGCRPGRAPGARRRRCLRAQPHRPGPESAGGVRLANPTGPLHVGHGGALSATACAGCSKPPAMTSPASSTTTTPAQDRQPGALYRHAPASSQATMSVY